MPDDSERRGTVAAGFHKAVEETEPQTEDVEKIEQNVQEDQVEVTDFAKETEHEVAQTLALKKQQTKKECDDWEAEMKAE